MKTSLYEDWKKHAFSNQYNVTLEIGKPLRETVLGHDVYSAMGLLCLLIDSKYMTRSKLSTYPPKHIQREIGELAIKATYKNMKSSDTLFDFFRKMDVDLEYGKK